MMFRRRFRRPQADPGAGAEDGGGVGDTAVDDPGDIPAGRGDPAGEDDGGTAVAAAPGRVASGDDGADGTARADGTPDDDTADDAPDGDTPAGHDDVADAPVGDDGAGGGPADDGAGDRASEDAPAGDTPAGDEGAGGDAAGGGAGRPVARRVAAASATVLAGVLVVAALVAPDQINRLTPGAFARIPLEAVVGVTVLLILPSRARRPVAAVLGALLGLLAIVKIVDLGFSAALSRPFNPTYDWPLIPAAVQLVKASVGEAGAIGAVAGTVVLVAAVLTLMALSVLRLSRTLARHRSGAASGAAVLGVAWAACAALGAQLVPGVPIAGFSYDHSRAVIASLHDKKAFAEESAVDAFAGTPGDRLLTGLRGKNVVLTFVESYGRDAIEDPRYAKGVDAVLDNGTRELAAAGFSARSAFLTSPTAGGGSWLAHSTLQSGLWIDNQQRYDTLIKSHRLTLTRAFRQAGWHTVSVAPGTTGPWPEGAFYGYQQEYDRWTMGYRGPRFNWGMPPDQYTLSMFQHAVMAAPHAAPIMSEVVLVSSHAPWAPRPQMIDWNRVGDGSAFDGMAQAAAQPGTVWRDVGRIRAAYRDSIEYSLTALISWVRTYGDKNLVLVFLGDHEPTPLVNGMGADRDVPIVIVARDKKVLDRISGWSWQYGLRPGPKAPVWPMNAFRDRFLTAFGSQPAREAR